ncbi:MAG: hypothetical protein HY078_01865 [Elusimicrobia bacterium]|nr:hypothetical protein [Elusimicrobiota bacterium]
MRFKARYREAVNAFMILDCVSEWRPEFCGDKGAYRRDWDRRGAATEEDKALFQQYGDAMIRQRWHGVAPDDELFGMPYQGGPVEEAFYDAETIEDALARAAPSLSTEDAAFFARFYAHFKPRLESYLKENAPFVGAAAAMDARLRNPEYGRFFAEVQKFFGVQIDLDYTALYVWWPPIDYDLAFAVGARLILQKNPADISERSDSIVFHEVVHTITARQDPRRKKRLARAFLDGFPPECNIGAVPRTVLLEEPLAVTIGQMLFWKRFHPDRFASETNWYNEPWVNRFSPAMFPVIERAFAEGRVLDEELLREAAARCVLVGRAG